MNGYTDVHSHFLYGIDDGAQSKAEMEAMLDAAFADGITSLFATPHVTPGVYPPNHDLVRRRLEEAKAYCYAKGYPMQLYSGAEIMFTPALERIAMEGNLPGLDNSANILLEFVPDISYQEMESAVGMLARAGYNVILAHIERYDCLFHWKNAYRLKDRYDLRYQVNCNSVLQKKGFIRDQYLMMWLKSGLVDFIATDSHDTRRRPSRMDAAYAALIEKYPEDYVNRLVGLYLPDNR